MDPLKPTPSLLCKLASALVHTDEAASTGGHVFDVDALRSVLSDGEVEQWVEAMSKIGMAPVKRG